jgi:hypothetical protein
MFTTIASVFNPLGTSLKLAVLLSYPLLGHLLEEKISLYREPLSLHALVEGHPVPTEHQNQHVGSGPWKEQSHLLKMTVCICLQRVSSNKEDSQQCTRTFPFLLIQASWIIIVNIFQNYIFFSFISILFDNIFHMVTCRLTNFTHALSCTTHTYIHTHTYDPDVGYELFNPLWTCIDITLVSN